jgi:hypothetical protein
MNKPTQSRLNVIVSARAYGFSLLTGVDEVGTLTTMRALKAEIVVAKIPWPPSRRLISADRK